MAAVAANAAANAAAKSQERKQFLFDVFVTAIEGGIGYWSACHEYHWKREGASEGWADENQDLDGFFAVISVDDEDDGVRDPAPKLLRVDASVIARGVNAIAKRTATFGTKPLNGGPDSLAGRIAKANRENDAGDLDAGDADCIVQAGLWNDVVYG